MTRPGPEFVEVLNGRIAEGDRIAWAAREGNTGEIRTGTVVEIYDTGRTTRVYSRETGYEPRPVIRVKARIDKSSGWGGDSGNVVGIEKHKRIVKMS